MSEARTDCPFCGRKAAQGHLKDAHASACPRWQRAYRPPVDVFASVRVPPWERARKVGGR